MLILYHFSFFVMEPIVLWRLTCNSYTIGPWRERTVYFKISQNKSGAFRLEYLMTINFLQM